MDGTSGRITDRLSSVGRNDLLGTDVGISLRDRRALTRIIHEYGGVHTCDALYSARREPPRLSVPHMGKEPVSAGSGWEGKSDVASSPRIAAALPGTRRVLARRGWAGKKVACLSVLKLCWSEPRKGPFSLRFRINRGFQHPALSMAYRRFLCTLNLKKLDLGWAS